VQRKLQRQLSRKLAPHQICCFAEMTELAVPVIVGGEHAATLLGGQVFRRKPQRQQFDRLHRQLRKWGMRNHARELERAYFKTPVVSQKKIKAAMQLLSILAAQLAEFTSRCILIGQSSEPLGVTEARTFIHAHAGEQLTTRRIAENVHISERYFCKIFKRSTGMTLTEFVARVRVEKAKKLLCDLRLRITDVAERAGFNSISQFNRVFRRYTKKSPSAYRAACR
jgi:AraC-like DNA-binding protein